MFERETERRGDADEDGEQRRYRLSSRPGGDQRRIGQGDDEHDLLALADVHPRQSRQA